MSVLNRRNVNRRDRLPSLVFIRAVGCYRCFVGFKKQAIRLLQVHRKRACATSLQFMDAFRPGIRGPKIGERISGSKRSQPKPDLFRHVEAVQPFTGDFILDRPTQTCYR